MPLKLNVGLSKKVGDANYGSRGASVNVEVELESALVDDPDKLKDRIRQIFDSLRSSLVEELSGSGKSTLATNAASGSQNGSSHQNDTGHVPPNHGAAPPMRPATPNQISTIYAISRNQGLDVAQFLRDRFGRDRPEDLNIKEASGAIDDLKGRRNNAGTTPSEGAKNPAST